MASEPMLGKLADALGIPISAFSEPSLGGADQTIELLRLWTGIVGVEDRAEVLASMLRMTTGRRSG